MTGQLDYPGILEQLSTETKNSVHEVLMWLELLAEDTLTPAQCLHIEQCRKALQRTVRANEDANLLGSNARAEPELESFSAADRIRSIVEVLGPLAAQRNLEMNIDVPPAMPVIRGDRTAFEQVVSRTLGFAIRSAENARLSLHARCSPQTGNTTAETLVSVRLSQGSAASHDISLQVAAQFALRMGGRLGHVVADEIQGFDFTFTTPLAAGAGQESGEAPRLRVLVAEDSDESFALLSTLIQDQPYSISRAVDGEAAVSMAISGQYEIAFMDITMPRLNGYLATLRIREWETQNCRRRMPIIVLSADPLESQMREGATVGCSGYLEKPVPKAVLLETLGRYGTDLRRDQPEFTRRPNPASQDRNSRSANHMMVEVSSLFRPIVPQFLETQKNYVTALEEALNRGDFERIRIIGHNMKGTGKGYGFEPITEIGKAIESAGQTEDARTIRLELVSLAKYLSEVNVVYT